MPVGDERPSYEELADLVVSQARVIEQLRVDVAELRAENERLRAENAELPPVGDELDQLLEASLLRWAGQTGTEEVVARQD